ncbi:MAG TPA: RES family NAD+ phosphorylase [Verrucomicrobium sp.]|nr:RES family NAD+ phosphorylase [Verrucomicrobium sp.]
MADVVEAWRICKAKHAGTAFSGGGAAIAGGRWNSRGVRVVYTSASQSLALLENLVHVNPAVTFHLVAFRLKIPVDMILDIEMGQLPPNWRDSPPPMTVQKIGDVWANSSRSAVLGLPSVIVPGERNYLLNPGHPDFRHITVDGPVDFPVDPRLI